MGYVIPSELSAATIAKINQFTKNFEVKVLLFRNYHASTTIDSNPVSTGDYSTSTGIYSLPRRVWLKKVWVYSSSSNTGLKVEYKDENDNWVVCLVMTDINSPAFFIADFEVAMYASDWRFSLFDETDPSSVDRPTDLRFFSESYLDVTRDVKLDISMESSVDVISQNVKLPYSSITLENSDGRWVKNTTNKKKYYQGRTADAVDTGFEYLSANTGDGIRFVVMIKYYGLSWEDDEWIILSNFYGRKWSLNEVAGETAWAGKVKLAPPVHENKSVADTLENIIAMKDGKALIQINKPPYEEVVTVENEYVGDVELYLTDSPPQTADALLAGSKIWAHCRDDQYIYYAITKEIDLGTNWPADNYTMQIVRVTHSGESAETIGYVTTSSADKYTAGVQYNWNAWKSQTWSSLPPFTSTQMTGWIRNIYMDCDDDYLYFSLVTLARIEYDAPVTINDWESVIIRCTKDGSNWGQVFPYKESGQDSGSSTPYRNSFGSGNIKRSLHGFRTWNGSGDFDNPSVGGWERYGAICRYESGGTEYLLALELQRNYGRTGAAVQQVYRLPTDLSSYTYINDLPNDICIWSIMKYDDDRFCVMWRNNGTSKNYLGMAGFDNSGNFVIFDYGYTEINTVTKGLSFLSDSIYASGVDYSHSSMSVGTDGIKQAYKCIFIADGNNLIHELHATNNEYLSHRFPLITVAGSDITKERIEYGIEYVDGDLFYSIGWIINLRTGEIKFRQIIPPLSEGSDIRISYDFINRFLFFIMDTKNRLGGDCLGKISQSQFDNFHFNEYGALERVPFLQSQTISMKQSVLDYYRIETDNGNWDDVNDLNFTFGGTSNPDHLLSFEFVPDYDGVLNSIKIPVRLHATSTLAGNPWNPIDIDLYLTDDGVEYECADTIHPDTPPTSADIVSLGSFELFIDKSRVVGTGGGGAIQAGDESPYYWRTFDVSAADVSVEAGKSYGIIIRGEVSGDYLIYCTLAKIVAMTTENRTIESYINDGADITTLSSSSWNAPDSGSSNGLCVLSVIEIRKDKVELKSSDIIDSLNPNISSGFISIMGGSDTTIVVKSHDLQTEYDRGAPGCHYNITYSGGKFYISNDWGILTIDDIIVVQWFDSKSDLIQVTSEPKDMLSEAMRRNDETNFLGVSLRGEKLLPAPRSVAIEQIFTIGQGTEEPLSASTDQKIEGDSADSVRSWNETKKKFESPDVESAASTKFALDFKDPFICGTTGYVVRYGKGLSTDTIEDGSFTPGSSRDVPMFYRINMLSPGTGFSNDDYHIMFHDENYRTWRLANGGDRTDMIDNTVVADTGVADTHFSGSDDGEPLKGEDWFYVKHMNKYYDGGDTLYWIAYESEERVYYIDENGAVIHDTSYLNNSDKNPIKSSYLEKAIYVKFTPEDFKQQPLFEYHGDSGETGYDSSYSSKVKAWMRVKIDRIDIKANGVSALFTNITTFNKFIRVLVIGYPLNYRIGVEYEKKVSGSDHADARIFDSENSLIQSYEVARLKGNQILDFWGVNHEPITRTIPFNPSIRPGAVVRLSSDILGLEDRLYYVHNRSGIIAPTSGLETELKDMFAI